jgi:hypothetical protein
MHSINSGISVRFADLPDEALVRLPMALAVTGWAKTRFYAGIRQRVLDPMMTVLELFNGYDHKRPKCPDLNEDDMAGIMRLLVMGAHVELMVLSAGNMRGYWLPSAYLDDVLQEWVEVGGAA